MYISWEEEKRVESHPNQSMLVVFFSYWKPVNPIPSGIDRLIFFNLVTNFTCVPFNGHMLAIGGEHCDDTGTEPTTAVQRYDPISNSWNVIGQILPIRSKCFVAFVPDNRAADGGRRLLWYLWTCNRQCGICSECEIILT